MGANIEPLRPAQIVARRAVEARTSLGWSQARLAEELAELGYVKSRSTLTKLEGGQYRGVSVDDVLALSAALSVFPRDMLTPLEDEEQVKVTPRVTLPARLARRWISGEEMPPMLPDLNYAQVPLAVLAAAVQAWQVRRIHPVAYALSREALAADAQRIAADMQKQSRKAGRGGKRRSTAHRQG